MRDAFLSLKKKNHIPKPRELIDCHFSKRKFTNSQQKAIERKLTKSINKQDNLLRFSKILKRLHSS
jgi:hypothetical protein